MSVLEDKRRYKIELFDEEVLREYDIRGKFEKNLTLNTAYTLGLSFGNILSNKSKYKNIAVGYDGRITSPPLHKALCAGLDDSGLNVKSIGLCPTPMLYFAIHHLKMDAGIMVTGSHNPPEYNGFKMVVNNKPFYSRDILGLQNVAKRLINKITLKKGNISNINILNDYSQRISRDIKIKKKIRVAWDPGNGSVGVVIRKILGKIRNLENFVINEEVDGNFPNHHPDPTIEKNLVQIQNLVKKNKCDLGLAFDGDGDRLGIVDNNGKVIWADRYMILLTEEISKLYKNPNIIMDVKSSKVFFDEVLKMGCKPLMYKTGHSVIKDKMKDLNSPLAGEMSGHIMYKDNFYGHDDAFYVALRFLQIISKRKEPLSEIMESYPNTFSTPETRIEVIESRKFDIVKEITDRLKKRKLDVVSIDGIRVESQYGWWGIRASNTQNALTVRAEANDKVNLKEFTENIEKELKMSGVEFRFFS